MAKMYPLVLNPDHPRFTGQRGHAEYDFYYTLMEQLSDDWTVLWGRDLQSPVSVDGSAEGEADFILIHPKYGIFVLEVKGGGLQYRPDEHIWVTWGRDSDHALAKSPAYQVKRTCRLLQNIIHKDSQSPHYMRSREFTICWAVVFNQCTLDGILPADLCREVIIDSKNLGKLEGYLIYSVHKYFFDQAFKRMIEDDKRSRSSRYNHSLGSYSLNVHDDIRFRAFHVDIDGWNYLRTKFLASELLVKPIDLASQLKQESKKIVQLTDDQYQAIETLESKDFLQSRVKGCSGSGKTLCAVELAKRFAKKKKYVLVLCFNPALSNWLSRETKKYSHFIRTSTIHDFCRSEVHDLHSTHGLPPERYTDVIDYEWPLSLQEHLSSSSRRYDVVIVDEAQDYRGLWWDVIPQLLRDDESRFYVFYDENQILYEDSAIQDIPIAGPPLTLRRNCRNTQSIHNFISKFYGDSDDLICQGPEGTLPKLFVYDDDEQQRDGVRRLFARWGEGFRNQDTQPFNRVIALTLHGRTSTFLSGTEKLGNVNLKERPNRLSEVETINQEPYTVLWSTDRRFKGLESDAVVLVDIDQASEDAFADELLYVGGSRAKHRLYGFVHRSALTWLLPRVGDLVELYNDIGVLSSLEL